MATPHGDTPAPATGHGPAPADGHAPAGGHGSTEAAHESGGLPQFEFEYWGGQIVWLLLLFAILYVLIAKVFAPRLRGVMDLRAKTIGDAIDEARKVQAETEAQAAAAEAELAEARSRAHRTAAEAKARIGEDVARRQAAEEARLNERLAEAEARIRAMQEKAMTGVAGIAADTAQAIAEKLTGDKVSRAEVDAALARVQTQGAA